MVRPFLVVVGALVGTTGCSSIDAAGPVALARDTTHPLEVHVWWETADGAFVRDPAPIARGLSSLHVVTQDGELWTPVLQSIREPTWIEEAFPSLKVAYLASSDGRGWEYRTVPVDAPGHALIDPAFVRGPEGLELWFVQHDAVGDPAHASGDVRVVRTRWDGHGFGDASVWWTGPAVLDPAPVFHDGRWRVFATQGSNVVEVIEGGRVLPVLRDATVPWAFTDARGLGLLAQRLYEGKMLPIEARPAPDAWVDVRVPLRFDAATQSTRTCASPGWTTAAAGGAGRLLLCVDETHAHGGAADQRPRQRGDAGRPAR
jgi:hypothetical protein